MNKLVRLPERQTDMPPEAPLAFPAQRLDRPFRDPVAPPVPKTASRWAWRAGVFLPAILATATLVLVFTEFFSMDGLNAFETALVSLVAFSSFWIAMSVTMAIAGLLRPKPKTDAPACALDVALLVPVHNEVPENVFGNALAMLDDLADADTNHRYSLYILSDTRDPERVDSERRAFEALRRVAPGPVFYRNHPTNSEKKIGNIGQWICGWGGAYEAMLVLDADSLMAAQAITALSDAMAADPSAGLIQSTPRIIEADTLFGRIQQFATCVYGPVLSAGLAQWTGRDGNYWGHNAIIRTRAFAACAGLPRLGKTLIMSHDFVEAALLRRAGWSVRMLASEPGSYEEAPKNLVDYVRRDARWCCGNLQHLRLVATPGLHPVSRFHLFQGAMSYLVSPVWLALLFIWASIGVGEERSLIVYFSGNDPRPNWPELTEARQVALLLLMYGLLLFPKFLGAGRILLQSASNFGNRSMFGVSVLTEIVLSVAYAPILMVQQTRAVLISILGLSGGWRPYRSSERGPSLGELLVFHAAETVIGFALTAGILLGYVTLWLLPIGLSLAMAVPLSRASGFSLAHMPKLMATPEDLDPPEVLKAMRAARTTFAALDDPVSIAAE